MARRRETAAAFDQVITAIRELPGFGDFLQPPAVKALVTAATEGPVVIVTVSTFGSYAVILTGRGVLPPVPLAALPPENVQQRVIAFVTALEEISAPAASGGARLAAEQQLTDALGWLWDAVTGPVLDQLGITGRPREGEPWPRVWWCTASLLSFLPLHAAGHHDTRFDTAPATVMDRVVSSSTPTIRALIHARRTAFRLPRHG